MIPKPFVLPAAVALAALLSFPVAFAAENPDGAYAALLERYVTPAGVRYASWRSSPADVQALSEVVARFSAVAPGGMAPRDRHALSINLYNAKILEIVLAGKPVESIKDLSHGKFGYEIFSRPVLAFDGAKLSLTDLETRLREESNDPRIHFAINCASRSCPPILAEPYRGRSLDAQLDRATRAFLAVPGSVRIKKEKPLTLEVSKIFDWYEKDFRSAGGVAAFLRKYGPPPIASRLDAAGGAVKITHQDYDWSLNAS